MKKTFHTDTSMCQACVPTLLVFAMVSAVLTAILAAISEPAAAQIPNEKPVVVLPERPLFEQGEPPLFWGQLTTQQTFLSTPHHPQTYRLDLGGKVHPRLALGGQISMLSHGFRQALYAQTDMEVRLNPSAEWQILCGLHAGFNYATFRFDEVITEHPFWQDVIEHDGARYLAGTSMGAGYTSLEHYHWGWQSQAFIESDGKTWSLHNRFFFHTPERPQNSYRFTTFLTHRFYRKTSQTEHTSTQTEQTPSPTPQHYYALGLQADLLEARLGFETTYETSREVQTFALGVRFTLCKGLSVQYAFNLPFRFSGLQTGAPTHLLQLRYQLYKQTLSRPDPNTI